MTVEGAYRISRVDLRGKRAIVTGARHGLGAETARALAAAGASVALCARSAGDCAQVVDEICLAGGTAFEMELDVSRLSEVPARIELAAARLGGIDILINNAATIDPMALLADLDVEAFDYSCRVNLSGPVAVTCAAWKFLGGAGRVVNLLSGAAVKPVTGWAAYCASKAGLLMITRMINLEGNASGIRAFGFAPGLVDTDMQASIRKTGINEISKLPRSALLPPSEPAAVIAWLVSGAVDDLAGEMLDIRDENLQRRMCSP